MKKIIDKKLIDYVEKNIFLEYENNIGGHNLDHIKTVINRCFEIIEEFNLDVNYNMIYVIASIHDIGYKINADNHELVSANMFLEDKFFKSYFNKEQIKIIYEAIIDHRASLEYDARSIYGKIVSSADRETSVDNVLKKSYLYQKDKHKHEFLKPIEIIEFSYQKLSSKYGKEGYAKMYFKDQKYLDFINNMNKLLENKELFIKRELEIAKLFNLDDKMM